MFLFQTELDVSIKRKTNVFQNQRPNGLDHLILRFRGYWDNRYELEGELHFYEVLYHLVDDTMELVEEIVDENDFSTIHRKLFVKRQKLPKVCTTNFSLIEIKFYNPLMLN